MAHVWCRRWKDLVHQWRTVFNVHVNRSALPWCPRWRHPILNHEEEPRQGKSKRWYEDVHVT